MSEKFTHEELVRRIEGLEAARDDLKKSESHLRILVDTIPDLVWLKDPKGVYICCNALFEKFFGADESEIVGKTDYDFVDRELADFFRKNDLRALASDRPAMNEERLTFARGGYQGLFETIKTPMRDSGGDLIGVLGIARDITRRTRVEARLKETERKLREAQKMASLGFWAWDIRTGEVEWSQEVYRIFKLDPDTFTPQIDSILALSPWPGEQERGKELIQKAVESREPGTYEQRFLFPDNSVGHYLSTFQGVYDQDGCLAKIKGTVQDITGKKRAEEEQKKMEAALRQAQKMEAIGRLAGGVAHDFNNMLSIIMGNVELALDELGAGSPVRRRLKEIYAAGERSGNLTRQLLGFARKQTIAPRLLDLNRVINEMMKMLKRLIGEDIDLVWQPHSPLESVEIDPSQVDQILANLCINARDAINGVGKVTIETGVVVFDDAYCRAHQGFIPGRFVMVGVSDNGAGMDKSTLANLFEPFFTTKEERGSGLGLATVYGIVKQNKGFINVYSEPGRGSTFKLYFPSRAKVTAQEVEKKRAGLFSGGSGTILLVEDEAPILNMTKSILERMGYQVLAAAGPAEALEMTRTLPAIDLLMTDVVMPEMNGKDLSEKLQGRYPDLKCLFMSGYTENVIAHHGVLDKGVAFIGKPFTSRSLGEKLREMLEGG